MGKKLKKKGKLQPKGGRFLKPENKKGKIEKGGGGSSPKKKDEKRLGANTNSGT